MGFNAQQNVSTGGYIDATKGIRDVLSGTQDRLFKQGLQQDRLRQNAIDNAYRKEEADAQALYRQGMTNRANAAEARAAETYSADKSAREAALATSGLYSEATGVIPGALQGDALQEAITTKTGTIADAPEYQQASVDMAKTGDQIISLDAKIKEAKKTASEGKGSRRISAENRLPALEAERAKLNNITLRDATALANRFGTDAAKVAADVAADNVGKKQTNSEYFKSSQESLADQFEATYGRAPTKYEKQSLDEKAKGYVDLRMATAKAAEDAATGLAKLQSETTIKEKTKQQYAKEDKAGKSKEQKARFDYEEAKAKLDSGNFSGSGNWFGMADGDEEKALLAKIAAYENTYGKPSN